MQIQDTKNLNPERFEMGTSKISEVLNGVQTI